MAFDLHPLAVHFPIALLVFYAVLECARFKKLTSQKWFFFVKAMLVIAGTLGACVALLTGNIAGENMEGSISEDVMGMHSLFAYTATVIFGVIALLYLLAWISHGVQSRFLKRVRSFVESWVMVIPAVLGLVAIIVIGALGAVLVYGKDIDPVVRWIYSLFF
jgi:uncharacterized membrane protein